MRRRSIITVLAAVAALAVVLPATTASAYPGAPWFEPGLPYDQNFPDPSVIVDGGSYYAYGTNTGGAYLPTMTSSDLGTWRARDRYQPNPYNSDPFFNDALPDEPSWAFDNGSGHPHLTADISAPGVGKIGAKYVAYLTVRVASNRYCIGVADSSSPSGPFTNRGNGPLVCDSDPVGSIDPEPFVDHDGTPHLLWKSEGVPGSTPTRLWTRQLSTDGLAFAPGSSAKELLRTSSSWEGNVIENPSMVRYGGRYYLFYSGNEWASGNYRTGYAICSGARGPCTRASSTPLLGNTGSWLGPGGADAFVDLQGNLRLAYHAWNAPYTSYPSYPGCQPRCDDYGQRFLRLTRLYVDGAGQLVLSDPALSAGRHFYVSNRLTGGSADFSFTYGRAGDEVFVGDWNGDRRDTLAVRRDRTFHLNNALRGGPADTTFTYGRLGDEVFVGDWNGDGRDTFAVRRDRTFHLNNALRGGPADTTFTYGRLGDQVLVGDWDGDRDDTLSVRRGRTMYLNDDLRGGPADVTFSYGREGDEIFVGDWDGDRDDTFTVRR